MSDTLIIGGTTYENVEGIKATDDNGNMLTYIRPQGTLNITENNTYNVAQYASANVNVVSGWKKFRDVLITSAKSTPNVTYTTTTVDNNELITGITFTVDDNNLPFEYNDIMVIGILKASGVNTGIALISGPISSNICVASLYRTFNTTYKVIEFKTQMIDGYRFLEGWTGTQYATSCTPIGANQLVGNMAYGGNLTNFIKNYTNASPLFSTITNLSLTSGNGLEGRVIFFGK